ncbi:MAG: pyridoxal phosphate-dependent aminotransferase [Lachnospiraceae bacterium]
MIAEKMKGFVANSSAIRAMFEEGKKMAAVYGAENVYDFSLGNPNVPAPAEVADAIREILATEDPVLVHGYMNNSGYEDVREAVAASLNERFGTKYTAGNILMTVGAAGGMNVFFKTLLNPGDEVLTVSPYFGEYRSYVGNYDGKLVAVPADSVTFQPEAEAIRAAITERTRALILNSPNNPTGAVYTKESISAVTAVLREAEEKYGKPIYLFSDEPYREIAYDGADIPWMPSFYADTVVGYSYSKSLSLPGERIGYLVIPSEIEGFEDFMSAANTANRILGFVNAPSLMQRAVAKCLNCRADVAYYDANRQMLTENLAKNGFTFVEPKGAFYLWIKSPVADEKTFVNKAKEERILIVPGSSFGCAGWVRLAYCVSAKTVEGALPGFKKLAEFYGLS